MYLPQKISFNKYLLSICQMPVSILGTEDLAMNKIPCSGGGGGGPGERNLSEGDKWYGDIQRKRLRCAMRKDLATFK